MDSVFATIPALIIVGGVVGLALIFILCESPSGRRLIAFGEALLTEWAYLSPLLGYCAVIVVEYAFDVRFLKEPSQSHNPPEFYWANPTIDSAAATRAASALYSLEIVYVALSTAVFVTIVYCVGVIYQSWRNTPRKHRVALFVTVGIIAEVNYMLWFSLNPLENVLSNTLTEKANAILGLNEPLEILTLLTLCSIWLTAMTSGFIVAQEASDLMVVQVQLDRLTVLLYLVAAVLICYMFVLAGSVFSAGSLLAQGTDTYGALVRDLALAEALNFGVFWTLLLAAIHYPSVWAIMRKPCPDGLIDRESPSATFYYRKVATTLSIFSPLMLAVATKLLGSLVK